uniref:GrpB family protein n=1 Tax=Staphylococcus aureus TaxID=1280 RepID=UPI001F012846
VGYDQDEFYEIKQFLTIQLMSDMAGISRETAGHIIHELKDEKRLNYVGFYRLHHKYNKKVMMAKFNNFHELKQQVRLHIIQMNTQTFESYLALDYLLSTNDDIALQFNTKKHQILQHSLTIRQYEMQKQQYFEKLCKKYL